MSRPDGAPPPPDETNAKPAPPLRTVAFALIVPVAAAVVYVTGATGYFTHSHIVGVLDAMGPVKAGVAFIGFYIVGTLLTVPGTILTFIGGALFGPFVGTGLILIGATTGATLAFSVSRYFARDFLARRFGKTAWFRRLDDGIAREGIWFILFIRLVPVFPFNWINYAAGLTGVRFRDYVAGTAVGIVPATFVYANAAAQATVAVEKGLTPGFLGALALLGLLALAPVVWKRYRGVKDGEERARDTECRPPRER
jgi:uncharacterized membrane protein YdjX (TVP38/TMEM64 family)